MRSGAILLALAPVLLSACARGVGDEGVANAATSETASTPARTVPVTITGPGGRHVFTVEVAGSAAAQEQGLMYRTDLGRDGGMLFWPYPPEGGPARAATFWMKNTPMPLDIIFIRADGSIAHIAENTIPYSEAMIPSGEPVAAVLELVGGRTAETGVSEGDKVSWPGR